MTVVIEFTTIAKFSHFLLAAKAAEHNNVVVIPPHRKQRTHTNQAPTLQSWASIIGPASFASIGAIVSFFWSNSRLALSPSPFDPGNWWIDVLLLPPLSRHYHSLRLSLCCLLPFWDKLSSLLSIDSINALAVHLRPLLLLFLLCLHCLTCADSWAAANAAALKLLIRLPLFALTLLCQ